VDRYAVHAVFWREFALLPGLVRAVGAGDIDRAQIVLDLFPRHRPARHVAQRHRQHDGPVCPGQRDERVVIARAEPVRKALTRIRNLVGAPAPQMPIGAALTWGDYRCEAMIISVGEAPIWWSGHVAGSGGVSRASDGAEALAGALEQLVVVLYEHKDLEEKLGLPLVERHIRAVSAAARGAPERGSERRGAGDQRGQGLPRARPGGPGPDAWTETGEIAAEVIITGVRTGR
jgi:hypothetical protein